MLPFGLRSERVVVGWGGAWWRGTEGKRHKAEVYRPNNQLTQEGHISGQRKGLAKSWK